MKVSLGAAQRRQGWIGVAAQRQPASQPAPISARRWGGDKDGTGEDAPETAARTTDSCDGNVVKGIEVDLGMLHSVNWGGMF